jgi:pimeloyl-ACP methyl ester carboxylesterase
VEMEPEKLNIPRLLHPAEFAATNKIARLEPYDPNKTVVLLVHGLASSPITWFPLLNHLRADPVIRDNYQFWFYSYPSGYPYPYSAAIMRKELDEAEQRYPSNKKMVVIGHSMGGCISRVLITDSERRIWDKMFTVPPEKMEVTPEHKHILTESSIFAHRPEIGRVIFISTPHRGSDLATNWLGQVFTRLVKLPETLVSVGLDEARYIRNAPGHKHLDRFPDSVDTLAPNNDFVVAINEVPIRPGIPYHTIAGDRGKGDSPNSSDGVVPYWSSHQAGAESELIVPSNHGAHQTKQAIAEVDRILKENLRKSR